MPRAMNPAWTREELILALDVYLRHGAAGRTHTAVKELSDLLQYVGPRSQAGDPDRFRNTNGVAMKLGNFMAVDPGTTAQGLGHGGRKAEQEVWDEFAGNPSLLAAEVARIKSEAVRGGGRVPAAGAAAPAEATTPEHVARPRSRGQGLMSDVKRRLAVERRAVTVAIQHYEAEGWSVEDVGTVESYDLRCHRGTEEMHVEVKGTTGAGATVVLTANEVEHAETFDRVALVVVSDIVVSRDGDPVASGGELAVHDPWKLDRSRLRARVFEYSVPDADRTGGV